MRLKKLKVLKCYVKALIEFCKYGVFVPHVYKDSSAERATIISTDTGFRVAKDWIHEPNEAVHHNALLVTSKCVCCGKEVQSWYRNSCDYGKEGWNL